MKEKSGITFFFKTSQENFFVVVCTTFLNDRFGSLRDDKKVFCFSFFFPGVEGQ